MDRNLGNLQVNDAADTDQQAQGHVQDRLDIHLFQMALAEVDGGAPAALIPVHDAEGKLIDCNVLSHLDGTQNGAPHNLLVMDGDRANTAHMYVVKDKFALSTSKGDVLEALVRGLSSAEISELRGVSLATRRTQVRHLLEKTGSANLADMIRQMGQISAQLTSVDIARKAAQGDQGGGVDYAASPPAMAVSWPFETLGIRMVAPSCSSTT